MDKRHPPLKRAWIHSKSTQTSTICNSVSSVAGSRSGQPCDDPCDNPCDPCDRRCHHHCHHCHRYHQDRAMETGLEEVERVLVMIS